ncbi:MAG: acylphosphatase [Saprospiraceae bacterium]|nr:acylphosphatase [Saprospiraceae bacterium]
MSKGVEIRVYGRVQGVWFRGNTQKKAADLKIKGWVRNEPDGSVLIHAFGISKALSELQEWCQEGPTHARVEKMEVRDIPYHEYSGFAIQR